MVMEEQQSDMELDSERVPVPQVQKSVAESHIDAINKVGSNSRGKPRLRKKALHAAILKQMEFYFGDANLSKDRFLNNLIKEDPYVDLNVFINFNKIKELTTDINRIAKALQASTILSLSENGMKVRRITPIVLKENTDECTVYIQNLPPDTDHETLNTIFSHYGQVVYVSVPRFKNNRKIKGFAFVEFDSPESANKCIKAFKKKGCVLPSHTAPNELLSIATFDDVEKDVTLLGKQANLDERNNCNKDIDDNEESTCMEIDGRENWEENVKIEDCSDSEENKIKKQAKKRKCNDTESSEAVEIDTQKDIELTKIKIKKSKHTDNGDSEGTETTNEIDGDISAGSTQKKAHKCRRNISINEEEMLNNCDKGEQVIATGGTSLNTEDHENTSEKKKKRKKRKKRNNIEDFSYSMGLQVMAKKDWKHLRNKYLELQRSKMKQLKQHLRKTRWNQWANYEKSKPEKEETDEKDKTVNQNDITSTCRFSFIPRVIVKIVMDKPCMDPKGLKMELKSNNFIKYIDVEEGSCLAHVRCDTTEAAQTFIQKSNEERHMMILEGEEEKAYWDKILRDREEKLSKKVKVKQRGRTKLLKKAEKELGKHIKFDEV